jgi:hypothetical protein
MHSLPFLDSLGPEGVVFVVVFAVVAVAALVVIVRSIVRQEPPR